MFGTSIKYTCPADGVVPELWLFLLVAFAAIHEFLCILQFLHSVPRIMGRPPALLFDEIFHESLFRVRVCVLFAYQEGFRSHILSGQGLRYRPPVLVLVPEASGMGQTPLVLVRQ